MIELYEYGIHTEKSDIRAHVSVVNRRVYVFETHKAIETISNKEYPKRYASQPGCNNEPTALGFIVPWKDIPDIKEVEARGWRGWSEFRHEMTTSEKGNHAVQLVVRLMEIGRFPMWLKNQSETQDTEIQIKGVDIIVRMNKLIQVKCDWSAGPKEKGGTGNLFLQIAESNPLKRH